MKEGKFNFLDLQREELSDKEIKEIYSKDNVKKSEGYDSDETKGEKTLQKLEEESFDISSKLEKNPNDKKLIEKYAEIEAKIKKIKESEVKNYSLEEKVDEWADKAIEEKKEEKKSKPVKSEDKTGEKIEEIIVRREDIKAEDYKTYELLDSEKLTLEDVKDIKKIIEKGQEVRGKEIEELVNELKRLKDINKKNIIIKKIEHLDNERRAFEVMFEKATSIEKEKTERKIAEAANPENLKDEEKINDVKELERIGNRELEINAENVRKIESFMREFHTKYLKDQDLTNEEEKKLYDKAMKWFITRRTELEKEAKERKPIESEIPENKKEKEKIEGQITEAQREVETLKNITDEEIEKQKPTAEMTKEEEKEANKFADKVQAVIGRLKEFEGVEIDKNNKDMARKAIGNYEIIIEEVSQKIAEAEKEQMRSYYDMWRRELDKYSKEYKRIKTEIYEKEETFEERVVRVKKEIFENAGSKSKEDLWELISDVEEILFKENEEGKGKLRDTIQEIKNSEHGKEKFMDDSVVYLPDDGEAVFVGDTHGDPDATVSIVEQEKFIEAMEADEKNKYLVFLGDYADRGLGDIENLEQIIALKKKYPDNVILLRGNHEEFSTGDYYGLSSSISKRYEEDMDKKDKGRLFKKYNKLFEKMPGVVVCANGIVAVHGGIPSEDIKSLKDLNDEDKLYQMRWNDPIVSEDYKEWNINYDRGGNEDNKISSFGRDAFDRFMKTIGGRVMIRAHQYENIGKPIFDNKLVTIFSNGKGGEKSHYNAPYVIPKYAKFSLENEINKIDATDIKQVNYEKMNYELEVKEEKREEMEEKLAKANRILFLYAKRDKLIDVNLVSQTNKEIRNLYEELGDIEKLRGILVIEEYEKIKQVGAEIEAEKMDRVKDTKKNEAIEPEPEKEKVPRSLKESREKIEKTVDVLYARLAEESKKLEEELSEEERTEVIEKVEKLQGTLAILGLSVQSIRATEASSLKPKEEKEILKNVVETHKLELKNYERIFGASLEKVEDSLIKVLESKSSKVQMAINNLTEASLKGKDRGIKEKIKNFFSKKSGEEKESNASKIDKKGKEDVLNSIKDAKDIKELKKIAGELKEKETEKNQEFLRSLIGHLEQFIDKGEFKKANDEAEKLRETLNNRFEVKDINEKEFKVLESFLNQFEIFRQDIANKKVDELFERKKSELKEKLDNAKDAEGFKSLIKLLKEVRKNIDDDQMALLMTLIDFKGNNALDRCSDIFENKDDTNNAENNNSIKEYIKKGREEIEKLNEDGAFKIFMVHLFDIVDKLRDKLYDTPPLY